MPLAAPFVWALIATLALPVQDPSAQADALWDAARAGDRARVASLLDAGGDVNVRTRYGGMAIGNAHHDVARSLLEHGSSGAAMALAAAIRAKDVALARAALAGPDLDAASLETARQLAARPGGDEGVL